MHRLPAVTLTAAVLIHSPWGACESGAYAAGHLSLYPPDTDDLPDLHSSQADDPDAKKRTFQSRVLDRKGSRYGMEASVQLIKNINIKATYAEGPVTGINQVLKSSNSPLGAWKLNFDSSLMDGALKFFGEADTAFLDPLNNRQSDQNDRGMMKMGFSGTRGDFSYGAATGFAGNGHRNPLDGKLVDGSWRGKQRTEIWTGWQVGDFNIKASAITSTKLKTKATDPLRKDQQLGVTLGYTFSSWPSVGASVSYFSGRYLSDQSGSGGTSGISVPFNRFVASSYFSADTWSTYVSSSYSQASSDPSNSTFPETDVYHGAGLSLYPNAEFNMSLSLGLYQQRYSYGAQMNGFDGSYWVGYTPEGSLIRFSSSASYSKSRADTWYYHTSGLYLDNSITWLIDQSSTQSKALSLHFGYNSYLDQFNSGSTLSDYYVGLVFSVGRPVGLGLSPNRFRGECEINPVSLGGC